MTAGLLSIIAFMLAYNALLTLALVFSGRSVDWSGWVPVKIRELAK